MGECDFVRLEVAWSVVLDVCGGKRLFGSPGI
jgi:hypothetical protein